MCGILGVHGTAATPMNQQLKLLTHRGPDHHDMIQVDKMLLGHTRLSIVDVEYGDQPLQSPDGRYWLISNGEIYNHETIRTQLSDYAFQTNSDSEVILALYQKYGVKAVHHLDGMFAFALYDRVEDTVFMARDPIGIKPLYYGWNNGQLFFASEIKSLQNDVQNLHEFPPGHYYFNGELTPYYTLTDEPTVTADESTPTLQDIRNTLTEAVHKRLMSDVPLGVYLSGGLDSTIVTAIVAQVKPDVHSFAVGVEGSIDVENARRAAEVLGTQHHEYIYTRDEIVAALPEIIYYLESFDPVLVRSAIPNYFLARMTRKYVTVVLTGEGADELYAGYHYLKAIEDEDTLRSELVSLTNTLYNCNLQRCDRMTMAHSIEARVPFLDIDFIELSMKVPKDHKIDPATQVEKWALREAFSDIVPDHVVNRKKQQFSEGAGSNNIMTEIADEQISDAEYAAQVAHIKDRTGLSITSKEMLMYYTIYRRFFSENAQALVHLWLGTAIYQQ